MGTVIYNIIVMPLVLIIELIFTAVYRTFHNPGVAIIGVSLAVNFLVLPLYRRADEIQEDERKKQEGMEKWVKHIRHTFAGDERSMMLQAYYKEQGYNPIYSLRSSISLLLQIPFFMAAYRYLSSLPILQGVGFMFINDLGKPDQLIRIGAISINLLPILMTLINCISGIIYTKGLPVKERIQIFTLAGLFLLFLYNSPAGLVFYWTLNNLFSLGKNVFLKLIPNPGKVLSICLCIGACGIYIALIGNNLLYTFRRRVVFSALLVLSFIPVLWICFSSMREKTGQRGVKEDRSVGVSSKTFFLCNVCIAILLGMLIPSQLISSSPIDFINRIDPMNPVMLIKSTLCYGVGFFVVWASVLFYLSSQKIKVYLSVVANLFLICGFVNYNLFGKNLGVIQSNLKFSDTISYTREEIIINSIVILFIILLVVYLVKTNATKRIVNAIYALFAITGIIVGIVNSIQIYNDASRVLNDDNSSFTKITEPILKLSKTNNNVIILMLDRAIGAYPEFIFHEMPELEEGFDGFVWYPNTISFGGTTNFSTPSLFGGYEYTPIEMDKRTEESIMEKHDEALLVMPMAFSRAGFDVTVCDPPYAGYQEIPDLSIYDGVPNVTTHITKGNCVVNEGEELVEKTNKDLERNLFLYSAFKTAPLIMQPAIYDDGNYYSLPEYYNHNLKFLESYTVLNDLISITDITDGSGQVLIMNNNTTHEPERLQLPDFSLVLNPNNENVEYSWSKTVGNHVMHFAEDSEHQESQKNHYMINVASYQQLAKWFSYLKNNDVYDNTRIIIVSDHGAWLGQFSYLWIDDEQLDLERYNPLLLIKDFNSRGNVKTNYSFMTCADVPTLALEDLVNQPMNYATGNIISNDEKYAHEQIIVTSNNGTISENNGNVFDISRKGNTSISDWYSVHDDIFDHSNWKAVEQAEVENIKSNGY